MTKIDVLYEDPSCFVINKPAGMAVHLASASHKGATVVEEMREKITKDFKDKLRPGIVHRLDKDTSGALIIARNQAAVDDLVSQFKNRKVQKVYLALVFGVLQYPEGIIDSPISRSYRDRKKMALAADNVGKQAISKYKVLKQFKIDSKYNASLLEVQIMTGRTHQIRVHMASIGHSVIGDKLYGNKKINKFFENKFGLTRQFLHSQKIQFKSPNTGKSVKIEAPLPEDLETVLIKLQQL